MSHFQLNRPSTETDLAFSEAIVWSRIIRKAVPTVITIVAVAACWVLAVRWWADRELHPVGAPEVVESAYVESMDVPEMITLPAGKLAAGRFESAPVGRQTIQHLHTVPGRIRYDETKHIDVKSPLTGILAEVHVLPGQQVEAGHLLAVLRSPEIGRARAEVLRCQEEYEIANQAFVRETEVANNLEALSTMLKQRKSIDEIEEVFAEKSLGSYRSDLLAAYARVLLASELSQKAKLIGQSGSLSGRTLRERETDRQIAEVAFSTAQDQARFSAQQSLLKTRSKVADAKRQLNLAWQAVETLLGHPIEKRSIDFADQESISRLEVRAPLSGTIESRAFASNERISVGDSLFVLANTGSLYVAASIREGDWYAVSLQPGTSVAVTVPALGDRVYSASLNYIGREVTAETNAIPLIAKVDNVDGLLRPGMFVRVSVPIGAPSKTLSVKPQSVVQHEDQKFVFVDEGDGKFMRVDVKTGGGSQDWVEIKEGLSPGQRVVTEGAFLLKSEYLLQGESE
mgnify:CR=1 FL=1